jgi:thioredoxin-like negative regulator of GroEL
VSSQLVAAAITVLVVAAALVVGRLRAVHGRRSVAGEQASPASSPYLLYFWVENCTACKTHQEPALRRLPGIRIEKIDALKELALAKRFGVYTLPTTVVVDRDGTPLQVNYGYADARKLRRQLEAASARQAVA